MTPPAAHATFANHEMKNLSIAKTKPRKCTSCREECIEQGSQYVAVDRARARCLECHERLFPGDIVDGTWGNALPAVPAPTPDAAPSSPLAMTQDDIPPAIGFAVASTQDLAIELLLKMVEGVYSATAIKEQISIVPDALNRMMLEQQILAATFAYRAGWSNQAGSFFAYPDFTARMQAADKVLAHSIGRPSLREVKKETKDGVSEKDRIGKMFLSKEAVKIYASFGIFAGEEVAKLVLHCGGDVSKIPKPINPLPDPR